jgi:hypothetical protein
MLVFIDESGDPGFKLGQGSSEVFVLAMVIFHDTAEAERTTSLIVDAQRRNRIKPEWKFAKSSNLARDDFFTTLAPARFACRCLVIRKELIRSENLKTNPRRFYSFFTRLMCQHDGGMLRDARIVIDGSGDRAFKQELQSYMRRELPQGTIKKMGFKDSRKDALVQLADMCAGAVARSYAENRAEAERWRNMLARSGQISDIWDFK